MAVCLGRLRRGEIQGRQGRTILTQTVSLVLRVRHFHAVHPEQR